MKRVRCPKCDNFITFDETKYEAGQSLVFVCPNCNKQFGIRMGVSKLRETRKEEKIDEQDGIAHDYGEQQKKQCHNENSLFLFRESLYHISHGAKIVFFFGKRCPLPPLRCLLPTK